MYAMIPCEEQELDIWLSAWVSVSFGSLHKFGYYLFGFRLIWV